jgi:hypothetical protein
LKCLLGKTPNLGRSLRVYWAGLFCGLIMPGKIDELIPMLYVPEIHEDNTPSLTFLSILSDNFAALFGHLLCLCAFFAMIGDRFIFGILGLINILVLIFVLAKFLRNRIKTVKLRFAFQWCLISIGVHLLKLSALIFIVLAVNKSSCTYELLFENSMAFLFTQVTSSSGLGLGHMIFEWINRSSVIQGAQYFHIYFILQVIVKMIGALCFMSLKVHFSQLKFLYFFKSGEKEGK